MASEIHQFTHAVEDFTERRRVEAMLHPFRAAAELAVLGGAAILFAGYADSISRRRESRRQTLNDAPYYAEVYGPQIDYRDELAKKEREQNGD